MRAEAGAAAQEAPAVRASPGASGAAARLTAEAGRQAAGAEAREAAALVERQTATWWAGCRPDAPLGRGGCMRGAVLLILLLYVLPGLLVMVMVLMMRAMMMMVTPINT